MKRSLLPAALLAASICMVSAQANDAAQQPAAPGWPEQKCAIYKEAWAKLIAARGRQGLGPDFLRAHEEFLTSGCTVRNVCPRSAEELAAANTLTILAMNAKMASTFLPFACRK
jgi:hypothetical protein